MTEGEIYRKSGENETIASVSGSPLEKMLPPEHSDTVDDLAGGDKDVDADRAANVLEDTSDARAMFLMEGKARFSVSEGVSAGPFAERIRKLRRALASIMESLGRINE